MNDESRRQRDKRRQKIEQNPKNVRFEDLQRLLEAYDFELKRSKGSHHSFTGYVGEQKILIVVPYRRPLKEIYVKKVLDILNEIESLDDSSDVESETDDDE